MCQQWNHSGQSFYNLIKGEVFLKRFLSVGLIFLMLVLAACNGTSEAPASSSSSSSEDENRIPVKLIKHVDGDTTKFKVEGKKETVRYLLIDTPETVHPKNEVEPLGPEASDFVKKMLTQADRIELELDVSERDKYGRLLAYVYADGKSVQEELLKNGLARVAYVYQPNVKYVDRYREIQDAARKKEAGIWQYENYATDKGFDADAVDMNQEKKSATDKEKFVASKNSDVYHKMDCSDVPKIKPENRIFFETEEEAKNSGRERSRTPGCWD